MVAQLGFSGTVIIGAGPAGLSPLFAAASAGRLNALLRQGVTIVERGDTVGSGALSSYGIYSDSSAEAFLDIVLRSQEPLLRSLRDHPTAQQLISLGKKAAPLVLVAEFLGVAGNVLCGAVARSERSKVLLGTEAISVTQTMRGGWRTRLRHVASGAECEIESCAVLLSTGGHQPAGRLKSEAVAGRAFTLQQQGKLIQSGNVLSRGGITDIARRLGDIADPRVAVVGGSTSAGSVAAALLGEDSGISFQANAVTLMHRKPLRIFYESVEEALGDGYCEFSGNDVCPLTGRLYRLGGLRSTARELILAARDIGDRPGEHRLRLLQLQESNETEARKVLDDADLIIACFGYRPRLLPAFDYFGRPLNLREPNGQQWSVVDGRCRLLTETGAPIKGLFALGLAVGPGATRDHGGEANFAGQVNSLWLWQNVLGAKLAEEFLSLADARDLPREPVVDRSLPYIASAHASRSSSRLHSLLEAQ